MLDEDDDNRKEQHGDVDDTESTGKEPNVDAQVVDDDAVSDSNDDATDDDDDEDDVDEEVIDGEVETNERVVTAEEEEEEEVHQFLSTFNDSSNSTDDGGDTDRNKPQQPAQPRSSVQRRTSSLQLSLETLFRRKNTRSSSSGDAPRDGRRRTSNSRGLAFAQQARPTTFRITYNPEAMQWQYAEAYLYNHGMEWAVYLLFVAVQIVAGGHGAYQFTARGGFVTDDPLLRWTLPLARASGRLVTVNCALLLVTACKYTWTLIRTYIAPLLPIGFPIDNIMPKYHRMVAFWIIGMGSVLHTLPQVLNYATQSIVLEPHFRFWTYGDGFATTQLLITGILLAMIFWTFFITTLPAVRQTSAGFRWFWFFHMGGVATAYPLLLLHGTCKGHPLFFYVALCPLILYVVDVAMRQRGLSSTKVVAWKTHEDNGEHITELVLEQPKHFTYTPGQYAELQFSPISTREWHPFTIASAPSSSVEEDSEEKETLTFYIKSAGRWTEALYNYAYAYDLTQATRDLTQATKDVTIQIRGPHGAPAMNYFEYRHIIVIGSGIGVTPLMSIWKYLVNRATALHHDRHRNDSNRTVPASTRDDNSSRYGDDPVARFNDDEDDELFQQQQDKKERKIHKLAILVEKIIESMTVSMIILCLFVFGETLGVVLQMFGFEFMASILGSILALLALIIHGSNIIASTIALGIVPYIRLVKFWLELSIIIVDSATLGLSLMALTDHVNARDMNTMSFTFFGIVVVLHALRIFHIFYKTLKPPKPENATRINDSDSVSSKSDNEIHSIQGILIQKRFSGMRFAARSLMPPIEDGLSKVFSMKFYGTREKPKNDDHDDEALMKSMMMAPGHIRRVQDMHQIVKQTPDDYFQTGRPNWKQIFLKAMAKAHATNPKGEAVGVFFCGSPAIAHDLQCMAKEVTAQHQFARKHLDGTTCKCKLIVHSENF